MNKKICIMYDFYSEFGGVERIMHFQARVLKKAGYDVSFAFAFFDDKIAKQRLQGYRVIEYNKLPIKNEALQIATSLWHYDINKFRGFDLIICHSFPASCLAAKIKKKFGIPFIQHLHHPPQFLYDVKKDWASNTLKRKIAYFGGQLFVNYLKKLDKACLYEAKDYIIECNSVKRIIHKTYRITGQVIFPTFNPEFKILEQLKKQNYILASGRIVRQKRFDFLIKSFAKLPQKIKDDYKIYFAGKWDNKEKQNIELLAKKLDIHSRLVFLGSLDMNRLIKTYNQAKLTVLTCPKEWFGLVPIESMACGTPVVAWKDNMGPEETVIENKSGLLAQPYDIDDLAKKIEQALNKKWNRKQIRSVAEKFSEERMGEKLYNHTTQIF